MADRPLETTQITLGGEPQTHLVNQKRTDRYDVDIGRANDGESHMNNTPVDEPGWLGNPHPESEYGREKCIELFREDFAKRIESDPGFREALEELRGETLGCYCKPKSCHGDVIVEFLRNGELSEKEREKTTEG